MSMFHLPQVCDPAPLLRDVTRLPTLHDGHPAGSIFEKIVQRQAHLEAARDLDIEIGNTGRRRVLDALPHDWLALEGIAAQMRLGREAEVVARINGTVTLSMVAAEEQPTERDADGNEMPTHADPFE